MRAAVRALRRKQPASIVVAVPTAAPSTCDEFQTIADACICTITPEPFRAVGLWYEDFDQVDDQEVCQLLARSAPDRGGGETSPAPPPSGP
jgi:predicted phosphoribosyltransferase